MSHKILISLMFRKKLTWRAAQQMKKINKTEIRHNLTKLLPIFL